MTRFVHVTDLHLKPTTPLSVLRLMAGSIVSFHPDFVVCTGDLVARDTESQMHRAFSLAKEFLYYLDPIPVYSVPGNHDLYDVDFKPVSLFTDCIGPTTFTHRRDNLMVIGVNSAQQQDDQDIASIPDTRTRAAFEQVAHLLRRGDLTTTQIQYVAEQIATADKNDYRVLALHHHLIPVYNTTYNNYYNFDLVADAATLLDVLQRNRFDLVLCGHKHCLRLNVLNDMVLLNGGALFGVPDPSFNIVTVDDAVHIESFNPAAGQRRTLYYRPNPKFVP